MQLSPAQLVALLTQLLVNGPQLIAALRATFSDTDEAELQSQLEALRQSNDASYETVRAALAAKVS